MRFEDFYVGMQLRVTERLREFDVGQIVFVKHVDSEDESIAIAANGNLGILGTTYWIYKKSFSKLEPFKSLRADVQETIDYIKKYFGSTSEYEAILRKHEADPNGWDDCNFRALNGLPIEQLRELLFGQNEQVKAEPACLKQVISISEQQTNLQPTDYMSMIDAALITGDKEWFNELLQKSNEGAIS